MSMQSADSMRSSRCDVRALWLQDRPNGVVNERRNSGSARGTIVQRSVPALNMDHAYYQGHNGGGFSRQTIHILSALLACCGLAVAGSGILQCAGCIWLAISAPWGDFAASLSYAWGGWSSPQLLCSQCEVQYDLHIL